MKKNAKKKLFKSRHTGKVDRGSIFIVAIIATLAFVGYSFVGGVLPTELPGPNNNLVVVQPPTLGPAQKNLQLYTFLGATLTPLPTSSPQQPSLCNNKSVNTEPDILVGYSPAAGQSIDATGQIKVWVNDEGAPIIAPNEQINPGTGQITTPGDRTAKAPDGYLWEPALYIAPQTAESGGTPHFPDYIKGDYNSSGQGKGAGSKSAPIDPVPANSKPLKEHYTAEDIWNVSELNLPPGTYTAEFVIHDGDDDRGVGCVSITIGSGAPGASSPFTISPSQINFNGSPSQTITIKNNTSQSEGFSTGILWYGKASNWFTVTPAAQSVIPSGQSVTMTINLNTNFSALSPGTYTATLNIKDQSNNLLETIPVSATK